MKYELEEQEQVVTEAADAVNNAIQRATDSASKGHHLMLLVIQRLVKRVVFYHEFVVTEKQIKQIFEKTGRVKAKWFEYTRAPILDPEFWEKVMARIHERNVNRNSDEQVKAIIQEVEQEELDCNKRKKNKR
jgi:hypothetical protein